MCPAGTIDGSAAGINSCLPECGEGEGLMKECAQPDSGTAVGVCALGQTPMQDPTMCETDDDCTDMMFPTCGNFPMGMVCANFTHCILICNDGMNMFQCPPGMTCAASGACEY
jgi:hypothetical protein